MRPLGAADVSAAITFARQHDLEIAVRGGGHSTAGLSSVDDGLMIDLSLMNSVETDVAARRCRVGGGATIAQRDIATQQHGLAAPAGIVGHTGIGGLTLGGGMGWLTRKHGLAIDNLVSVEIVTADGEIHRASDANEPKLFWAIRGGGGNFGVVTEFEFQLHDVGPMVSFGLLWWPIEQAADVLRLTRNLYASMSTEMNIIVAGLSGPPLPFVPEAYQHAPGIGLAVTGFAPDGEHARIVERINAQLPPVAQMTTPIPYANLQQMFDDANAFGLLAYDKAAYVEELTDGAITVIAGQLARKSSPRSGLFIYRLDGAYSAVREEATAFGGGRSPALRHVPDRALRRPCRARDRHGVGARLLDGVAAARDGHRQLSQRRGRVPAGQDPRELRRDEVHPAVGHQAPLRPGQRVPPQRQHHPDAGSTSAARRQLSQPTRRSPPPTPANDHGSVIVCG